MTSFVKGLLIIVSLLATARCKHTNNLTMKYPPPSYLNGLVSPVSKKILSEIQMEYGANSTAFKFNTKFNSLIRTWLKEFKHFGGTVWGINITGNKVLLFDQYRHGYNALMKLNKEEDPDNTNIIGLPQQTEIIIAFQYSGDVDEYVETGPSKFKQDYFDWVVIYKKVDNKLEEILNYECA